MILIAMRVQLRPVWLRRIRFWSRVYALRGAIPAAPTEQPLMRLPVCIREYALCGSILIEDAHRTRFFGVVPAKKRILERLIRHFMAEERMQGDAAPSLRPMLV